MSKFAINTASIVLHNGGIVAYPTEAVYGLGCDPMNYASVEKLLNIKKRSVNKGLILVAASFDQLEPFIAKLPAGLFNKVMQSWPGPVNWLLPANPAAPEYLRGSHPLQAVRISDHPIVRGLCQHFGGAIISTSANLSSRPPAKSALQARLRFNRQINYVLAGSVGKQNQPCEIRNALNDELVRVSK